MFTGEEWKPIYFQRKKHRRAGCNMKRFDIYVKTEDIEKYGFEKVGNDYKLKAPRTQTRMILAWVNGADKKIHIASASSYTIRVLCEMYKDGKVRFEDYEANKKQQMYLTPEECRIIADYREKNR